MLSNSVLLNKMRRIKIEELPNYDIQGLKENILRAIEYSVKESNICESFEEILKILVNHLFFSKNFPESTSEIKVKLENDDSFGAFYSTSQAILAICENIQ